MKNAAKLTPKKAAGAIARAAGLIVRSPRTGKLVRQPVREEIAVETSEAALFASKPNATMSRYVAAHAAELGELLGCTVTRVAREYHASPRNSSGLTGQTAASQIILAPVS